MEKVVLVDAMDVEIGTMEKQEAHVKGLLHRAFSVFIFNSKGEMLIQKRALDKYHSPGLWTNACCSHPRQGETSLKAAERRLKEEMGMQTPLQFLFSFTYRAEFDNDLIEHEFDHVYVGQSDDLPEVNPLEVADYSYVNLSELHQMIEKDPQHFTPWFKIALPKLLKIYP